MWPVWLLVPIENRQNSNQGNENYRCEKAAEDFDGPVEVLPAAAHRFLERLHWSGRALIDPTVLFHLERLSTGLHGG